MSEEKESTKRKKRASGEPAQAANGQHMKAGEILRQARIAKGLELEEISSAIHVRVGQLKAIEENHLDALPGMTYALGFVKSYATYLKIDAADVVMKFKAENGAAQPKSMLQNSEPIATSKMPDPFLLGAAGVFVLVVVLIWAFFSGGDDDAHEIASAIPPAPAITAAPSLAPVAAPEVAEAAGDGLAPIATGPLTTAVTPVKDIAGAAPVTPASATVPVSGIPRQKPHAPSEAEVAPVAAPVVSTAPAAQTAPPSDNPEINIKGSRGRVVLKATQSSWVQVTDGNRNIVYKKVLRPGETFSVPDGSSYSLITSNAGGVDVYVDGARIKTLGGQGDIVRGVKLQPELLKRNRPRKSAFQE